MIIHASLTKVFSKLDGNKYNVVFQTSNGIFPLDKFRNKLKLLESNFFVKNKGTSICEFKIKFFCGKMNMQCIIIRDNVGNGLLPKKQHEY